MRDLISFEIKKIFSKKKNLALILFLVIFTAIYIGIISKADISYSENIVSSIEFQIQSIQDTAMTGLKSRIDEAEGNNELLRDLQNSYDEYSERVNKLNNLKTYYSSCNWKEYLKTKIDLDEKDLEDLKSGKVIGDENLDKLVEEIDINKILLEKSIKPINETLSMESFNFLKIFLNNPMILIVILFVILACCDIVSSEFERKTSRVLLTQPINKNKIIISKILAYIIFSSAIIFGVLIISFIVLGFIHGFGNSQYPVAAYIGGTKHYITILEFDLISIGLLVLLIVFLSLISVLISTITKNNGSSLSVSIILVVGLYMIINKGIVNSIAQFIPFAYVNIGDVLSGTLAKVLDNSNAGIFTNIAVLSIGIIILFIANLIVFNRHSFEK